MTNLQFNENDFIFLSPHKSLIAKGISSLITSKNKPDHLMDSDFQLEINSLLNKSRFSGEENPIVVGVIPFDKSMPYKIFTPKQYQWVDRKNMNNIYLPEKTKVHKVSIPNYDGFTSMVDNAIQKINLGLIDKVVLSRVLNIESNKNINALNLFLNLNYQNPLSYNFYIPIENKFLIGASPELLIRKVNKEIISMPLAGTMPRESNKSKDIASKDTLFNSLKDRYEHDFVIKYINTMLKPYCSELKLSAPFLFSTPTLWHFATKINGVLKDNTINSLALACLLHPTPALCGTPYLAANELINSIEPFERNFFGGIVGWCDSIGNGEWVVVIRSGMISCNKIQLFAGAGIVPDSVPELEWNETEAKLNTMLCAMNI